MKKGRRHLSSSQEQHSIKYFLQQIHAFVPLSSESENELKSAPGAEWDGEVGGDRTHHLQQTK